MEVCTNENTNKVFGGEDLSWALQIGDLDTVKEQLQRLTRENGNWDVNNVSNGRTMLHKACDFGHLDIVEYLIQNGADINKKDNFGITPLLCALWENHLSVAKYLIDKGATTTFLTPEGLKYYECIEDTDMIRLLKQLENK
ncbi:Ankyrin repeat-containing domain,Ankyrin repeat [Cinara cedri]|uniref:Ankyrin repeat-containing domain,Ankyrin repeat n=1 Tax=Cinara cedri TaxID=506608 RepID=A0A5E4M7H2_9HEMI|nr:Ankyrin repeat-containing domain,Ankyrin repeat [Cinara cedri]